VKNLFAVIGGMFFADREARGILSHTVLETLDALTDACLLSSSILQKYLYYRERRREKGDYRKNPPRALLGMDLSHMQ